MNLTNIPDTRHLPRDEAHSHRWMAGGLSHCQAQHDRVRLTSDLVCLGLDTLLNKSRIEKQKEKRKRNWTPFLYTHASPYIT